ncbi:hypothetical protein ACFSTE_13985 [Aquimarina hainanensis]|uniref:Uncharacterized protein n=1 Tax=Aquimarina hainanensis TaxID=1578017 RepID=A0ABW5N9H2_9FLAO|nr:hypothetical protein [Aquimarina sp. TRL1]QKX04004.1 hypothetical protein HN014_03490 [Aquimarina sp. TRL1]
MVQIQKHATIGIIYFCIIAFLGIILRMSHVIFLSTNYKHIVHTHSHVALLGWIYTGITSLIYQLYLSKRNIGKTYKRLFWCTQITIIGMLFTFPFTGYAFFSIVFSSLFIVASYYFFWLFIKNTTPEQKNSFSYALIRSALIYMILSSIGPWALGIIMNTLGSFSPWYKHAIYFYLHFQYNGWFFLSLLGVFFYILEQQKINIPRKRKRLLYYSFQIGILLSFFLSVLWNTPKSLVYLLAGTGAISQLLGLGVFIKISNSSFFIFRKDLSPFKRGLYRFILGLLCLKFFLQTLTAFPYFSNIVHSNLDLIIGYLHLTFLGIISLALLLFLNHFYLIVLPKTSMTLYLIGFIGSELLICYKGISIWLQLPLFSHYFFLLTLLSCFMPIGISFLLFSNLRHLNRSSLL